MALFHDEERVQAEALVKLSYCNPFLPERTEHERVVLSHEFVETDAAWHKHTDENSVSRPNLALMAQRAGELASRVRQRIMEGEQTDSEAATLYEDVVLYFLYHKHQGEMFDLIREAAPASARGGVVAQLYARYEEDMTHFLALPGHAFPTLERAGHFFACFFQVRRAFHHIFDNIIGGSMAAAWLRAAVWQSIFTCDMRRYRRGLYDRMSDITTLITGPSGTGKELVARAIGFSQYIPFDDQRKQFATDFSTVFHPVNLSALSPTLIESELFGHTKGAFTGAVQERAGYFEMCPAQGTVFLDEIGELDPAIQVKLLRVLETRTFQRIGDTATRRFLGKAVAATNRDLSEEMRQGRFRQDLYYRLCSDIIVTPALRDQLEGSPEQLRNLLLFITRRVAGEDEAAQLARQVEEWITANLGPEYPWQGNVRELEQCVRNVMVRNAYHPQERAQTAPRESFLEAVASGRLTADELLAHYCTLVYAQTRNYQETARRLGLDRRTIKSRVDEGLLEGYEPG
jgi:transcriptional regulator with AAA-type ATPase domain